VVYKKKHNTVVPLMILQIILMYLAWQFQQVREYVLLSSKRIIKNLSH